GSSDSTLGGLAAAGGTRGAGMTALAKVLAICAGTVGGAAACVATGVVPAPLLDSPAHHPTPPAKVAHHRHLAEDMESESSNYEPALPDETNEVEVEPEPQPKETAPPAKDEQRQEPERQKPDREEAPIEEAISETPPSDSGATEFTEAPPEPTVTETTSTYSAPSSSSSGASSSSSGTAAGEFGP
ncbi:MAG: hypothetical protein ACREJT_05470, partial [Myxococcota bacterium]